ncbi:hypothetical protein AVEN_84982-1 [Araneus ventricosus]|uniref:Uncharacterized protein n=1 Tax=Araneus ventricosus TaxID=182803 RepID=A0A4Y2BZP6_ARAVE|nr:hypothetical protein AVEN_84982-1 [Araneus ventricosus]
MASTRSPDLAACDFFLWGYLKAKVYTHKPKTLDELKDAIRLEIAAIPPAMVEKVMLNFRKRLHNMQSTLYLEELSEFL